MELISREDLIKYLKTYYPQYAVIIGVLQTQVPTIESRPKGEWIEQEGYDLDTYWECSECKSDFVLIDGTPKENGYNYCPYCGAELSQNTRGEE